MATVLRADGTREMLGVPAEGLSLTLCHFVGGYIEVVTLTASPRRREVLILDEDAQRPPGKPINREAAWFGEAGQEGHPLHPAAV